MKIPPLSLATLTAIIITAMLLLSVGLAYLGVNWYSNYLEEGLLRQLPVEAAAAYRNMNAGIVPDREGLKVLFDHLNGFSEPLDWHLYVSVLVSGLLSALICSVIGILLVRKIARPLEELTAVAEGLRSGDFSVRMMRNHKSTVEIKSLVESFNALATSLETMEKTLRFNNMAVAHELRTPLTILRGTMQGMVDGVFPMERNTLVNLLMQAEGLSRIVEDLRVLSLAVGQKLVMNRERVDLSALIKGVLETARPMLRASNLNVEAELCSSIANVDAQRIRQAILALVENTCRYASAGAILHCKLEQLADGTHRIQIADRGPGFPADMCAVEVKPFWRGEPSRSRATGGTGLGLSVVQAIAAAHGGKLELSNQTSGGACTTIMIPDV